MAEGTFSTLEIDATPEQLYDVAADVAAYPDWASGVKQVEVLDVDAEGRVDRARFVLEGFVKEITYVLQYTHDRPNLLSWVAVESDDLEMLEGSYQFTPTEDEATEVVYSLTVDPNFIIPGFIKRQAEKQIVSTALRGLRKRVAKGG
ncbi:MAG TPA: SRPBCC family protein [Acidimicrobiia bacterium]|nr:SRPBCC family protein [Acidimicrobiia bacterium]